MEGIHKVIRLTDWKIVRDGVQTMRRLKQLRMRADSGKKRGGLGGGLRQGFQESQGSTMEVTSITVDNNTVQNSTITQNSQASHLSNDESSLGRNKRSRSEDGRQ